MTRAWPECPRVAVKVPEGGTRFLQTSEAGPLDMGPEARRQARPPRPTGGAENAGAEIWAP